MWSAGEGRKLLIKGAGGVFGSRLLPGETQANTGGERGGMHDRVNALLTVSVGDYSRGETASTHVCQTSIMMWL